MKLLIAFVVVLLILSLLGLISIQDLLADALNGFFDLLKTLIGGAQ